MKRITYCYVDGHGNERVNHVSEERGGKVGYQVDEFTARIWMAVDSTGESETKVFPLARMVFIREITTIVESK